ncbi:hypothetical protein CA51_38300 [Rosistilla oblonga]|uniref:Uncharacterized protein n=1 Tax=Rosistilla oblonga TaxID=2527990 RepID=A0A518IXR6_9BACT|nr:hypothetical protein [Rosistilla oblonga]QDV13938.1 hypothetical protein CA51_38300 [Rosistilla oblonga]QDV57866.1 hypothetical protein Mal33_38810 [Rosistilla oblonga]
MNSQLGNRHNTLPSTLSKAVLTMQIISIALLFGAINIAVILVVMTMMRDDAVLKTNLDPLVIVVLGVAVMSTVVSVVLPSMLRRSAEQHASEARKLRDDANHPTIDPLAPLTEPEALMLTRYQTAHIVGAALLEGPAMLAAVVFFITSNAICLGIAVFMILLLATRVATQSKVVTWMEHTIRHAA